MMNKPTRLGFDTYGNIERDDQPPIKRPDGWQDLRPHLPKHYVRPEGSLTVVSVSDLTDEPTGEKSWAWTGVRGSMFNKSVIGALGVGLHEGELIPDPFNPVDGTAVVVHVDGRRLGYITPRLAYMIDTYLRYLNFHGQSVHTVVEISDPLVALNTEPDSTAVRDGESDVDDYDTYVACPLPAMLEQRISLHSIMATLEPLWVGLPVEVRDALAADGYHFTETTSRAFWDHRYLAPEYAFTPEFRFISIDRGCREFLQAKRRERNRQVVIERAQRNQQIAQLIANGTPAAQLAERFALKQSTIASIIRTEAKPKAGTGSVRRSAVDYAALCSKALGLRGATDTYVARRLRTHPDEVPQIVADAEFYLNPSTKPRRLRRAQMAHGDADDRSVGDMHVLSHLGRLWP
ncbi:MAG: hypothetical protein ACTHZ9_11660 [Leucobacter sp.]